MEKEGGREEQGEEEDEHEEEEEVLRSRLQLFSLAGGASSTDLQRSAKTLVFSQRLQESDVTYRCLEALAAFASNLLIY